jgi:hypothetical protein
VLLSANEMDKVQNGDVLVAEKGLIRIIKRKK